MALVRLICKYCDHKWDTHIYSRDAAFKTKCAKCGDRHIRVKDIEDDVIDTYAGSPPFPKEEISLEDAFQYFKPD